MAAPKSIITPQKTWAIWYAQNGFPVLPLLPGTKEPATPNGVYDATTDLDQVNALWTENPHYNIGITGLLFVDKDTYKANGGAVPFGTPRTVTVITPHDGEHLWFLMPEGKNYGCSRGTLPDWIDIKGEGGYVVAPPSVLIEDGKKLAYKFAPGRSPKQISPAPLPAELAVILDAAQHDTDAATAIFPDVRKNTPDVVRSLSGNLQELINQHTPKGQRSDVDWVITREAIKSGLTDDDIHAIFANYPCGDKYRQKGKHGEKYLTRTIRKARASTKVATQVPTPTGMDGLRTWAQSPALTTQLIDDGIARPAEVAKTLIALINRSIQLGTPHFLISTRQLGEMTSFSHMTAKRHLTKLSAKLITLTLDSDGRGYWVDLRQLLQSVTHSVPTVGECNRSQHMVDDHLADEAFVPYQHRFAAKMRPNAKILPYGLSAAALFVAAVLSERSELTRAQICQATGLTPYTVGKIMRRMETMGLLVVWKGKQYRYDLNPDFEAVLDDLRPMLPSYGIGQKHASDAMGARASYCEQKLTDCRLSLSSQERADLRARRDKYDKAQRVILDSLVSRGINPFAKLVERPAKHTSVQVTRIMPSQPMRVAA